MPGGVLERLARRQQRHGPPLRRRRPRPAARTDGGPADPSCGTSSWRTVTCARSAPSNSGSSSTTGDSSASRPAATSRMASTLVTTAFVRDATSNSVSAKDRQLARDELARAEGVVEHGGSPRHHAAPRFLELFRRPLRPYKACGRARIGASSRRDCTILGVARRDCGRVLSFLWTGGGRDER